MRRATILVAAVLLAVPALAGEPLHVLVVNDDGVDAPGIAAMAATLEADPAYRVTVVAPAEHQSGRSHAVVTRGPVRVRRHAPVGGAPAWAVAATPATTVRVALSALLADDPPQLVVSGINRGENDGILAWYSGTVGAAREAAIAGIPAVAVSLELDWERPAPDYTAAARLARPVVDAVARHGLPPGVLLNVNVPRDTATVKGYRLARMSVAPSSVERFDLERVDPDGTRYYAPRWRPAQDEDPGTDTWALDHGWVTVVPLGLEQTRLDAFPLLGWVAGLEPPVPPSAAANGG